MDVSDHMLAYWDMITPKAEEIAYSSMDVFAKLAHTLVCVAIRRGAEQEAFVLCLRSYLDLMVGFRSLVM